MTPASSTLYAEVTASTPGSRCSRATRTSAKSRWSSTTSTEIGRIGSVALMPSHGREQPELHRGTCCLGALMDAQLVQHAADVGAHGVDRDAEALCHHRRGHAVGDQLEDLSLAVGEQVQVRR